MAGPEFKAKVRASDWDSLADELVTVQALRAVGEDLAEDISSRIQRGIGSDGTPLPEHYVSTEKPRGRYIGNDKEGRAERDRLRQLNIEYEAETGKKFDSRRGSQDIPVPMSVLQVRRSLGGHFERPSAGTTWRNPDHIIRCGKDGANWGLAEGDIVYYQWDSAESFRRSNYGPQPGVRKGSMLKSMSVKVEQKPGHWLLTVGPKGKSLRKTPFYKVLIESGAANRAAAEGKKPKKFPVSMRMALLERLGRNGKVSQTEAEAVGVLDPSPATLSRTLQERLAEPFLRKLSKAPIKEVPPKTK